MFLRHFKLFLGTFFISRFTFNAIKYFFFIISINFNFPFFHQNFYAGVSVNEMVIGDEIRSRTGKITIDGTNL